MSFDYSATTSRCGTGEVCAARYFGLGLGFCTSNTTSTTLPQGSSCTSSEEGSWCDDDTLCLDWFGSASYSCEIPCDTTIPGICPSGQSCYALNANSTTGICQ
jgi:hypothetical protein